MVGTVHLDHDAHVRTRWATFRRDRLCSHPIGRTQAASAPMVARRGSHGSHGVLRTRTGSRQAATSAAGMAAAEPITMISPTAAADNSAPAMVSWRRVNRRVKRQQGRGGGYGTDCQGDGGSGHDESDESQPRGAQCTTGSVVLVDVVEHVQGTSLGEAEELMPQELGRVAAVEIQAAVRAPTRRSRNAAQSAESARRRSRSRK